MAEASKERAGRLWQGSRQREKAGPGRALGYIHGSPRPSRSVDGHFFSPTSEEEEEEADRVGESEGEDDGGAPASGEEILRPCAREISGTCPLLPPTPLPLPLPL